MIRCSNCGWSNNPAGSTKCEKCNAPLNGSMVMDEASSYSESENFISKKTVRESGGESSNYPIYEEETHSEFSSSSNMVCQNCGYPLRAGVKKCPQCKQPVSETINKEGSGMPPKTPFQQQQQGQQQQELRVCPKCGNENVPDAKFCASCGNPLLKKEDNICPQCGAKNNKGAKFCAYCGTKMKSNDLGGTILPSRMSRCTLSLIPEAGEEIEPVQLKFSDAEVILNRENTEPCNKTITREAQAALSYENKRWYIENKSAMNSTLILVKEKTELHPGDVIMLGDRKFEFNY